MAKKHETEKPEFARSSRTHNLSMGIVGLPNVGKSSIFNILTAGKAAVASRAFCTIDPNPGDIPIRDERLAVLDKIYQPEAVIRAHLHIMDIAGLIEGASLGRGLGNQFLAHLQAVDGIYHMVRCFEDQAIEHLGKRPNVIDPVADIELIHEEIRKRDLATMTKEYERERKKEPKPAQKHLNATIEKLIRYLESGTDARYGDFTANEVAVLNQYNLLTAKKVVYVANVTREDYLENGGGENYGKLRQHVQRKYPDAKICLISAAYEEEIDDKESRACGEMIWEGYRLLNLINFFTAGQKEVRSWTVRKNTKAKDAAAVIHTQIRDGFTSADVIKYADVERLYNAGKVAKQDILKAIKSHSLLHKKGKDYIVEDGDIVLFRHKAEKR